MLVGGTQHGAAQLQRQHSGFSLGVYSSTEIQEFLLKTWSQRGRSSAKESVHCYTCKALSALKKSQQQGNRWEMSIFLTLPLLSFKYPSMHQMYLRYFIQHNVLSPKCRQLNEHAVFLSFISSCFLFAERFTKKRCLWLFVSPPVSSCHRTSNLTSLHLTPTLAQQHLPHLSTSLYIWMCDRLCLCACKSLSASASEDSRRFKRAP